jgi:alginate O-acetyltransferase complex protein AlgJ
VFRRSYLYKVFVFAVSLMTIVPMPLKAEEEPVIFGKNDWLFVRYEVVHEGLDKESQLNLELIERVSRLLRATNVTLVLVVVPSKMETHVEQLPDGFRVSNYMSGFNDSIISTLQSKGVYVIDLKKRLREAAVGDPENPPFFRLDTHWTNTGAYVAAQTLREGILATPTLRNVLDETQAEAYELVWAPRKFRQRKIRDITKLLPPEARNFPPEESRRFDASAISKQKLTLQGESRNVGVTLLGSSYSDDWLGFPDALRFSLQRNILNFPINSDIGSFGALRRYLQNDAFQANKPKLLIWEIPERSIPVGPNGIRLQNYRVDRTEWLYEVAALTQGDCKTTSISAKFNSTIHKHIVEGREASTNENDFIEVTFDRPFDAKNYFSAMLKIEGSKQITIDAYDRTALVRKFTVDTVGDDLYHTLKTPLSINTRSVNRLKIYPGNARSVNLKDINICSYPLNY